MTAITTFLIGALALSSVSALQLPLTQQKQFPLGAEQPLSPTTRPLIDSGALQDTIHAKNLLSRANELYKIAQLSEDEYNHPTRVIGSQGHLATLSYIYSTLASLGDYYTLSNQSFPAVLGDIFESRLILNDNVLSSALPMSLTPPTTDREPVTGDLVAIDNAGCHATDFHTSVAGNIALIARGECSFGDKSKLAGQAGAVAAVVYNTSPSDFRGTLGASDPEHVATFGISGLEAMHYLRKLDRGETVSATAYIDSVVKTILTDNIIAQTRGGDPENCVMLGGHSDSVESGPGINDDGSGSLTLLEIATQLAKFEVKNCVRFAWWAGEEEGLLGSDYYVDVLPKEENLKIRLFMDYDMLGSPNFAYQIYDAKNTVNPVGSQELRDLYVKWYEEQGLNYTFIPFDGRSDYDAFIRHGIPGGGVGTGAEGIKTKKEAKMFGGQAGDWYDPCYHQLCDDVGNVNMTAWEINTKLVAHSVAQFALSFKDFPERTDTQTTGIYEESMKYHGHTLVI